MSYKLGDDLPLGIYRSNDNVKFLSIRVIFRKVTPSCLLNNSLSQKENNSGEMELLPLPSGDYSAFSVEHIFSWQQKVFDQVSVTDNDPTKQDTPAKRRCQATLFSNVDSDMSLEEWQRRRPVTYPPCYSYLEKKMSVRYRGKNFTPASRAIQKMPFSEGKPMIHIPTKESASHRLHSVGQFMSIMVAFNSYDSDEKEERELCIMHLDPDGCLTVKPDFSVNGVPYIMQNNKSEMFEYFIECTSRGIDKMEAETEKSIIRKLNLQRAEAIASAVGTVFDRPSSSMVFFLNGEITSSCRFNCNNLYVQYYFELPEGWKTDHEASLSGSTYSCKSKWVEHNSVAYFGFPFSLELEADVMQVIKEGGTLPGIQLFLEVISLDKWNNGRGEGYGYATIPICPGSYSVSINTWKILPVSLIQRLQHFFIGGTSYLEDVSSIRIPYSCKEPQLSKYGIRTESSGSVLLKYHGVIQIGSEVDKEKCEMYLHRSTRQHVKMPT